jgi:hypothetical protein
MAITSKPPTRRTRNPRQFPPTGWLASGKTAGSKKAALYPGEKFKTASKRIGEKPVDRLRWALDRFQQPPDELRAALELGLRGTLFYELMLFVGSNPSCSTEASRQEIIKALASVIAAARGLVAGLPWQLQVAAPLTQIISKEYAADSWKVHFERSYECDDFATKLLLRIGDLIMQPELAPLLSECARNDCDRLFIKRKRGLFCSRECIQKARLQHVHQWRSRQSTQELRDRRHRYYLNRLPAEIRTKVKRRPGKTE